MEIGGKSARGRIIPSQREELKYHITVERIKSPYKISLGKSLIESVPTLLEFISLVVRSTRRDSRFLRDVTRRSRNSKVMLLGCSLESVPPFYFEKYTNSITGYDLHFILLSRGPSFFQINQPTLARFTGWSLG